MSQTLTLREAGIRLGVSGKALKRLIRSGVLPEAHKVSSSSGRSWVIPVDALPSIAERQGWVIDLTGDEPFLDVEEGNHDSGQSDDQTELANEQASDRDLPMLIDPFNPTPVTAVRRVGQEPELAPEYETIRLDRLSSTESTIRQSESNSSRMADVYDLNPTHFHTPQSTNGNGVRPGFDHDRTGTEDPSPNDLKFPGATTAMNSKALNSNASDSKAMDPTPISQNDAESKELSDQVRAGQPPLPGQAPADIDLSAGTDLATVEMGAIIPHRSKDDSPTSSNESPSLADVLDVALLDRLLGAQEEKANALAQARQTEESLSALNERNEHALSELEVVRQEADLSADRLREERMARIVADAKVAELRDRVIREMTLADSEKQARVEATMRNIQAERDNANAYASMGWMARRRYRRLNRDQASSD